MSEFDQYFEFQIGEFAGLDGPRGGSFVLQVVSRWLEECSGGAQKHYSVRARHGGETALIEVSLDRVTFKVHELELRKLDAGIEGPSSCFEKGEE
jgi:hypothetical protein